MAEVIGGCFEIGERIGFGGMGIVYRGVDLQTGQPVAIKLLKPELVADKPDAIERFIREGEALRRLNHPNIVKTLLPPIHTKMTVIIWSWNMLAVVHWRAY